MMAHVAVSIATSSARESRGSGAFSSQPAQNHPRSYRRFPAFRAVEEHPDHQVIGELLEPVVDPGGDEEHVARPETMPLGPVPELATPSDNRIHLITRVGRLGIVPAWCIELDAQSAVLEELDEPLTVGTWKPSQALTDGELVPRH